MPYAPYLPYPWYAPGYAYPQYAKLRRAPGETYALVISWIVTAAAGLSILCGLLMSLVLLLSASEGRANSLTVLGSLTGYVVAPLAGGGFALYYGIRGILRRPSARFSLPNPWLFAVLAVVVLGVGLALWNYNATPGAAIAALPLVVLSGILPALAILAFAAWRLRMPSSRRHLWMSLIYGATLAPLLAVILEGIGTAVLALLLVAFGAHVSSSMINPTAANPNSPLEVFILLVIVSVIAPIVEEGVKPLGALLLMPRLRTASSAFLIGLGAGIGFDMFETIGYIGQGEADWVGVAIERLGAGLLHGVGAGMGALGWYYLVRGKGMRLRWLRGFGALGYAVLQHAIFNGSSVLSIAPGPVGRWMNAPFFLFHFPLDYGIVVFFGYYAIILGVLILVTGRLMRPGRPGNPGTIPPSDVASGSPQREPATLGGATR